MSDDHEIARLYAAYALAIDGGDMTALRGCFASDAVYEVVGSYEERGVDQIISRVESRRRDGWTHVTANLLLQLAPPTCLGRATFVVLDEGARPVASGEYEDDLARTADAGWVFAHRRIRYRGRAKSLSATR